MITLGEPMTPGQFITDATSLFGATVAQPDFPVPVLAERTRESGKLEARESTAEASNDPVNRHSRGGENNLSGSVVAAQQDRDTGDSGVGVQIASSDGSIPPAQSLPPESSEQSAAQPAFMAPAATLAPILGLPSLGDVFASGIPSLPSGPPCKTLPALSEAAGGLYGLWVIMGEPGVGKSALARQIACSAQRYMYVLDYDFENGPHVIAARLQSALGDQSGAVMRRWYVRDSITSLETDIGKLGNEKAMVIVDSFQSLPSSIEHSTESLSKWMSRFEKIARDGHFVVLISEKGRAHYGSTSMAGGKGTGALEYKAWFAASLLGDADDSGKPIEVHVVKNRHRKKRGLVCYLHRVKGGFWFEEFSHE